MRLDELSLVVRRSRRISKDSTPRRIIRLVPVFILETHNQTNYCFSDIDISQASGPYRGIEKKKIHKVYE